MSKRRGRDPYEDKALHALAEWLVLRRLPLIEAIVKDVVAEIDGLTDQRFLKDKVLETVATNALREIVNSYSNESLLKDKDPEKYIREKVAELHGLNNKRKVG